ncbi:SpoIIE family protein phosphatase [Streptomyces sp. NPDC048187]|uniref:SpoIIE family protein phosphatase n=1 Tax=Streptomyces sp. NPDC048187 TaxID=3365509 RepID=UPI0037219110
MGYPDPPPAAVSRRFSDGPVSVAAARRFVGTALDGAAPDLVDTARLLVSELVTNAVLHARTEVEVSVARLDGRVRVRVGDRRPGRGLVPQRCSPYSGTGQGLALVEQLASRYGADGGEAGKTVWFELWYDDPPPPSSGWETTAPPPAERTVTLVDVPTALEASCRQHRHAVLRELTLAAGTGDLLGVEPEDLAAANDVNNVVSARTIAALETSVPESGLRTLPLALPAGALPALRALRRVLDLAEERAREERLLTLPALPRGHVFQEWLFDEIVGQLAGSPPTAWTVVPREPEISSAELVPWDAGQVRAGRMPTIAADESNRIVAANEAAADLLGWTPDDLVGRRLTTLIPEHLRGRHTAAFTSMLLTGRTRIVGRSVPLPALHRDGRLVPVRLYIQTQETAEGRTVFVAQLAPRATTFPDAPKTAGRVREAAVGEPGGDRAPAVPASGAGRARDAHGGMSPLDRLGLLAELGAQLNNTLDLNEGLQRAGRLLTRQLADWCVVDLFTPDARVDRVCVVHRDPRALLPGAYEGLLSEVSEESRGPLARVLRGAGPLLLVDAPQPGQTESALDKEYVDLFRELGAGSAVVAPLRARRRIFGALTLARGAGGQPFSEADLTLVDDLVHGLALGVDNARLYQDTRSIAERLQRSLLPVLPEIPGLRLAARYAASSTTAQVGGDWYDSFVLPGGDTAVVIGDVTGHDLDAAIAMSQLRSMLRGIAVDRQEPPAEVLRRLDLANHSLHQEATATCVYGLLKEDAHGSWELTHSSAGHPPPLLTTHDGRARYLDGGAGVLLGMDPDLPRSTARHRLPARSTLVLYTDGLVERRDEPLDDALERLRRHAADLAHEPLDTFCDELLIGLGADSTDDIAVLAVRPTPPPG